MRFIYKKSILSLLGIIFLLGVILIVPNTLAIVRERNISTLADKDTYVDTASPTSNYGGVNYLMSGFSIFSDIKEAYFHFNFTDKPTSYIRAEISLDFWGVSQTMNFTVCLIEDSWNEYSMTWIAKPSKGQVINNIIVATNGIYKIDVSSLIAGRSDLSICVNIEIDNYVDDYAYITSREGYYVSEDAPQLQWIYTETADFSITSPSSSNTWQEGHTYTITWDSIGTITRVTIELFKALVLIEDITYTHTPNDGSYDFYVASYADYQEGSDYRIKISDYDDPNVYTFSDYFSISKASLSVPSYNLLIIALIIGACTTFLIPLIKKNSQIFI